jgi:ComF family protein
MRIGRLWNVALEILFPGKKTGVSLALVTKENFLPLLQVVRTPNDALAVLPYRHPLVRAAVVSLKFKRRKDIAEIFGAILADALSEDVADLISFGEMPIVIPIPLSKTRFHERGYNQSALIADVFAKHVGDLPVMNSVLDRTRDTPSQTSRESRQERIKNLKGAFAVIDETAVMKRTVFLIDDVTTTGATMGAAKAALISAGAKRVIPVAVAH